MKWCFSILFLLLFSGHLSAQIPAVEDGHDHSGVTETWEQMQERLAKRVIRMSVLSADYTTATVVPFDTVFDLPHRYRRTDELSAFNANLGSYGLPFYRISFFDRVGEADSYLYSIYYPFMQNGKNTLFMDTQVPFTEMRWSNTEPRETAEQTFSIRHTQNVNKYLNFGLVYDIDYNLGQYNYQMAENKNFGLHSSFTGKQYSYYFASGINNITSEENGGMQNADMNTLEGVATEDVPMNFSSLNNAKTMLRNRNLLFVQKLDIGGGDIREEADSSGVTPKNPFFKGTVSHIFEAEGNRRTYSDGQPGSGFYDSIYINNTNTFDSLLYRNIKNSLRFDFSANASGRFRLGGGVGIRHEYHRYGQIAPTFDTNVVDTLAWRQNNVAVVGKLYNTIGDKFGWEANGELYLSGYRSGDFDLEGKITKSFEFNKGMAQWNVTGEMENSSPSVWYSRWGSNNFVWDNALKNEFRSTVGSSFTYPARSFELRVNYAIIDNYTYFGENAMPSQYSGALSVASLYLNKDFTLWKLHLDNDILLQMSGNKGVVDLPLASVRSAFYLQHLFRFRRTGGKLEVQVGADVNYYTKYHPYSYMPATGQFYNQSVLSAGNYPYIDLFLDMRLKRARLFIMLDHANQGLTGNDYFHIPYYPLNTRMLRYGLAWTFYN